jgi:ribosomal protein S18 acetylase RimI-like enzyme
MNIDITKSTDRSDFPFSADQVATFLEDHLEQYGDKKEDILLCLDYVNKRGGLIIVAHEHQEILGVTILNETGMTGYIPENILVYIAVDRKARGKGVGRELMKTAFDKTVGNIALHVEPDNPAKKLYEKLGFTNKYLEMRWERTN